MTNTEVGKLSVWFDERGYGFTNVLRDGSVRRYFLHKSNILSGSPVKDAVVRFEPVSHPKGAIAAKAEIFSNWQEMERHDAAAALAAAAAPTNSETESSTPEAQAVNVRPVGSEQ